MSEGIDLLLLLALPVNDALSVNNNNDQNSGSPRLGQHLKHQTPNDHDFLLHYHRASRT